MRTYNEKNTIDFGETIQCTKCYLEFYKKDLKTLKKSHILAISELNDFWADIVFLLASYRELKNNNCSGIENLLEKINSDVYRGYIRAKILKIQEKNNKDTDKL